MKKQYWLLLAASLGLLAAQNGWALYTLIRFLAGDGYSIAYVIGRVVGLVLLLLALGYCIHCYRKAAR